MKTLSTVNEHLPKKVKPIITLLREELKANYFFNSLAKLGIDNCMYQPELGSVILELMGFTNCSDNFMNFYLNRLNYYTRKIKVNDRNLQHNEKALLLYNEINTRGKQVYSK